MCSKLHFWNGIACVATSGFAFICFFWTLDHHRKASRQEVHVSIGGTASLPQRRQELHMSIEGNESLPQGRLQNSRNLTNVPPHASRCVIWKLKTMQHPSVPACNWWISQQHLQSLSVEKWPLLGLLSKDMKPLPAMVKPKLDWIYLYEDTDVAPEFSVSYPIHNKGRLLNASFRSLLETMCGSFEVVVVLDDCMDNSGSVVLQIIEELHHKSLLGNTSVCEGVLKRVVVYTSSTPMFETAAENFVMRRTTPSGFYISAQADNIFFERGWNVYMSLPVRKNLNIFAVSGRCGHAFPECGGLHGGVVGDCKGERVKASSELRRMRFRIRFANAIVRSPILWRAKYMQQLGFFDEVQFKYGDDDIDLCRRASFLNWTCGVVFMMLFERRGPRHGPMRSMTKLETTKHISMLAQVRNEWQTRRIKAWDTWKARNEVFRPGTCGNRGSFRFDPPFENYGVNYSSPY